MSGRFNGPGYAEWRIWVGNTTMFRIGLSDNGGAIDLTGSLIVLTLTWPGDALTLRSDDVAPSVVILDQIDPLTRGWVAITLTPTQTRLFPIAGRIRYEIERRWVGVERTYLTGDVVAQTENNTDG